MSRTRLGAAIEKRSAVSALTPPAEFQTAFERQDWTALRSLETLPQFAGVPTEDLAKLVFKELVDNALDAGVGVAIRELRGGIVEVVDQGEGITGSDEEIARRFSIARPLSSTKLRRMPTRGAMGNGLRVVAGAVLASDGTLEVATCGRALTLEPRDDGTTAVLGSKPYAGSGTRIRALLGDALQDDDALAWAEAAIEMAEAAEQSYAGASSPYWYTDDAFFELCSASGDLHVRALVEQLDGCSGAKAGLIAAGHQGRRAMSLTREQAAALLETARQHAKPVRAERLGRVGPSYVAESIYQRRQGAVTLGGREVDAVVPYVVEAWATLVEDEEDVSVSLFVNRTPVTTPVRCWVTDGANKEIIFEGCGLDERVKLGRKLVRVAVNVDSPYVPVTSVGKAPDLTRFGAVVECIEKAVAAVKRGSTGESEPLNRRIMAAIPDAQEQLREGGYEFGQRNLFYAVRDLIEEPALKWEYFTSVVTDYEYERGADIEGMWRDDRGMLVEPHSRRVTMLGTRAVRDYQRPAWNFRRVLYVEKQLLLEWLMDDGFMERWDCALACAKGQSTRATRDCIDQLAATDEPVDFFAIHDCDAYGFGIFDALQNATKARGARKVQIIDLGLHRADAEAMGLEVEDLDEPKKGERPCGSQVSAEDKAWLQCHRVELDTLRPAPRFIAWADRVMSEHVDDPNQRKVVPPEDVLETTLRVRVEHHVRAHVQAEHQPTIDEQVRQRIALEEDAIAECAATLDEHVREALVEEPADHWTDPLDVIAEHIASPGEDAP